MNDPISVDNAICTKRSVIGPMELPEILENVLKYLDRRTLFSFRLISRIWHSCANIVLEQDYLIDYEELPLMLLQADDGHVFREEEQRAIDQYQRCCTAIHTLTLGDISLEPCFEYDKTNYLNARPAPFMKQLRYLTIGSLPVSDRRGAIENAVCDLLRNSPVLSELCFGNPIPEEFGPLFEKVMEQAGPQLRKVRLRGNIYENLGYLIKILCQREQKRLSTQALALLDKDVQVACPLEEIVFSYRVGLFSDLEEGFDSASVQGQLPIKSLALEHSYVHEPEFEFEDDTWESDDTLLKILQRCPQLKELRMGSEFLARYNPCTDGDFLNAFEHYMNPLFDYYNVFSISDGFVDGMLDACPKLTKLDIGGFGQFQQHQIERVISHYISQLESLRAWGLEYSLHLSSQQVFLDHNVLNLTELDISASNGLVHAIPIVLQSSPKLKLLLARSVRVYITELIGFDWICTGLEVLALRIIIPSSYEDTDDETDDEDDYGYGYDYDEQVARKKRRMDDKGQEMKSDLDVDDKESKRD
ncbi:hypothetical protein BGW38_003539, partial [Lunasporangiospora selenospora]